MQVAPLAAVGGSDGNTIRWDVDALQLTLPDFVLAQFFLEAARHFAGFVMAIPLAKVKELAASISRHAPDAADARGFVFVVRKQRGGGGRPAHGRRRLRFVIVARFFLARFVPVTLRVERNGARKSVA